MGHAARGVHSIALVVLCVLALCTTNASALTEWTWHRTANGAHPSGHEQALMWLMNRARTDPAREGRWLANARARAISGARENYDVNRNMLVREFAEINPSPPAAFDVRLFMAARTHALRLIRRDAQDHIGQLDLIEHFGFNMHVATGNVFSFADSALNAHAAFAIDWGPGPGNMQTDRPHRTGPFNIGHEFSNVGFAVVPDTDPQTRVGSLVVVSNHASTWHDNVSHYNAFIVGTVWQDRNNNTIYDPGEGIGGVTVTPDDGVYYAVTAAGGGYAIPLRGRRPGSILFSGGGVIPRRMGLPANLMRSVLRDYQITQ